MIEPQPDKQTDTPLIISLIVRMDLFESQSNDKRISYIVNIKFVYKQVKYNSKNDSEKDKLTKLMNLF